MAYKKTSKKYKYKRNKNIVFSAKSKAKKRTFSRKDYMSGDGMLTLSLIHISEPTRPY